MTTIYMHKNLINGKVYIGQTQKSTRVRWKAGYKNSTKFNNAIKKYGWEGFEHTIICECEDWEADLLEQGFIKKYNSVANGYNLQYGGKKHKRISQETRDRLSKAGMGRTFSQASREKMSRAQKGYHNSKATEFKKGHKTSEEIKKKISEKNKGMSQPWKGIKRTPEQVQAMMDRAKKKPVAQLDLEGNIVKIWESATEAAKQGGFDKAHIGHCCLGKNYNKTHKGYKWKFI